MESLTPPAESKISAHSALPDELIIQAISKVDCSALGIAVGALLGTGIFLFTNLLILKEDILVSQFLALLNQYFWGYTVSFTGSLIGLGYGFVFGFVLGWFIAFLRNFAIKIYLYIAKYKERMVSVNNFIDYP